METGMAIGLGLLRGLTEFLPISWEGHLAFLRMISGMAAPSSVVELCLHLGLLAALLLCYGKRLVSMFAHPLQSELKWLILSVGPAVAAAYTVRDQISGLYQSRYLGPIFLISSLILMIGQGVGTFYKEPRGHVRFYDALVMGALRAVSILPGMSPNGSAMAGGLATGLKRKRAADFAFCMAVPVVIWDMVRDVQAVSAQAAAQETGLWVLFRDQITSAGYAPLISAGCAMIAGAAAIRLMVGLVKRGNLKWFSVYTLLLGLSIIAWQLIQGGEL